LANNSCVKYHIKIPSSCLENVKSFRDYFLPPSVGLQQYVM